jgi:hypothetical protein
MMRCSSRFWRSPQCRAFERSAWVKWLGLWMCTKNKDFGLLLSRRTESSDFKTLIHVPTARV